MADLDLALLSDLTGLVKRGPGRPDAPAGTGGVITGSEPVGTLYISTDGAGVGALQWQKTTAGWVVTVGDTGIRNITALLNPDVVNTASSYMTVKRVSDAIIWGVNVQLKDATPRYINVPLLASPLPGWAPSSRSGPLIALHEPYPISESGVPLEAAVNIEGQLSVSPLTGPLPANSRVRFLRNIYSGKLWPSTLPGVAA